MVRNFTRSALILAAAALLLAGVAAADSLSVTSAAAMGGAANANCSGDGLPGPCGLAVFHDNSSSAYVQDDTPDAESTYRAEFQFDPNGFANGATGSFRQNILTIFTLNPQPNLFSCPGSGRTPMLRVFVQYRQSTGEYFLQGIGNGNRCGARAIFFGAGNDRRLAISDDQQKICVEIETGSSNSGRVRLTSVGVNDACPTSADVLPWGSREISNHLEAADRVRMGIPGTNNFGVGEVGTLYFDEFASFRTLSP